MATWDKTVNCGTVGLVSAMPVQVFKSRIDINAIAGLAANDIIDVFKLPQGCVLLAFGLKVVVAPKGTALTLTFGSAGGAGGSIGGAAAVLAGSTPQALGVVDPATLTTPVFNSMVPAPANYFEWMETEMVTTMSSGQYTAQPVLTVSPTTVTGVTDFGEYDFYAVVADLTGIVARDPASARVLTEFSNVTGAPVV
jgi:hypothetical protein